MKAAELLDNIGGAVVVAGALAAAPILYGRYMRWGATEAECARPLPGDSLVPDSRHTFTRAITIDAPVSEVWGWVAQIGQERGGLYSYELLENLAGCRMHNAAQVVAEHQLRVGDKVRLGPKGYPLYEVVALEQEHTLILGGADFVTEQAPDFGAPIPATFNHATWTFTLLRAGDGARRAQTRLLMRGRMNYAPVTFGMRLLWTVTDVVGFVMMRRMLLGIKARAEAARRVNNHRTVQAV